MTNSTTKNTNTTNKKASSKEIFEILNTLRIENGKDAYKKCWESKKAMLAKIVIEKEIAKENEKLEETFSNEDEKKTFSVADLSRELGIEPKNARRILRKIKNLPNTTEPGKWEFSIDHKITITKIIKK